VFSLSFSLSRVLFVTFCSYGSDLEGYATIFCWAIVWGIGDAIVISQISALLGTLFPLDTVWIIEYIPIYDPSWLATHYQTRKSIITYQVVLGIYQNILNF
jgi:hypothetical protein